MLTPLQGCPVDSGGQGQGWAGRGGRAGVPAGCTALAYTGNPQMVCFREASCCVNSLNKATEQQAPGLL